MTSWLVDLLILLGVLCIVLVAAWFILSQVNLPEPINKIILIVCVVIVAVIAIIILLKLPGGRIGHSGVGSGVFAQSDYPMPPIPPGPPPVCKNC